MLIKNIHIKLCKLNQIGRLNGFLKIIKKKTINNQKIKKLDLNYIRMESFNEKSIMEMK